MHNSQPSNHERTINGQVAPTNFGMDPDLMLSLLKERHQGEQILSLRDFIRTIRRRLWVIVLVVVMIVGAVVGYSLMQTPTYQASIKILVGQERSSYQTYNLHNEVVGIQQITKTVVEAFKIRPVAQDVIQRLGLSASPESFLANLNVEQIGDTEFVQVSYEDPDPNRAALVANTVGDVVGEQLQETSLSANAIHATIMEPAVVPGSPVSPDVKRNALLALILGLMLGVGLAFLLEYMADKPRLLEEVAQVPGIANHEVVQNPQTSKKEDTV